MSQVKKRPAAPAPKPEVVPQAPWAEQMRGLAMQFLAPTVSLLIAAVIGALVILVVQRSWADVVEVAGAM
jgi:uncharacterized membrane protein YcfT